MEDYYPQYVTSRTSQQKTDDRPLTRPSTLQRKKAWSDQISYLQLNQEFAGLGGNVGFFKNELELQVKDKILLLSYWVCFCHFSEIHHSLWFDCFPISPQANLPVTSDITLQASLHGGMIRALQGDKTFNISDHFFLGPSNYLILFMFEVEMF